MRVPGLRLQGRARTMLCGRAGFLLVSLLGLLVGAFFGFVGSVFPPREYWFRSCFLSVFLSQLLSPARSLDGRAVCDSWLHMAGVPSKVMCHVIHAPCSRGGQDRVKHRVFTRQSSICSTGSNSLQLYPTLSNSLHPAPIRSIRGKNTARRLLV